MLFPLRLPLAGVHGAERRDSCGNLHHAEFDARTEMALIAEITAFAQARPGLLVEAKPGAVALHYRQRASLQAECLAFAATIVGRHPSVRLLEGKMVLEFSLSRRNKGDAIADFMRESPFAGRKVFFAGDDKTDEAGFEAVNNMGGVTVKIGSGVTAARFRVADTGEFADLLHRMSLGPAGSKGTNIRTDHSRCAKR
jgi:trehalose 6-phosphate phosphatase